jgi:hypothetical protein
VQYSQDAEAAAASAAEGETAAADTAEAEEVSMEEVLGKGSRRAAAAEEALETPRA